MRTRLAVRNLDIHLSNWSASGETSVSRHRHKCWRLGGVCNSACHLSLLSFRKYRFICDMRQMVSSLQIQTLV
jgi:hypothetical protein